MVVLNENVIEDLVSRSKPSSRLVVLYNKRGITHELILPTKSDPNAYVRVTGAHSTSPKKIPLDNANRLLLNLGKDNKAIVLATINKDGSIDQIKMVSKRYKPQALVELGNLIRSYTSGGVVKLWVDQST